MWEAWQPGTPHEREQGVAKAQQGALLGDQVGIAVNQLCNRYVLNTVNGSHRGLCLQDVACQLHAHYRGAKTDGWMLHFHKEPCKRGAKDSQLGHGWFLPYGMLSCHPHTPVCCTTKLPAPTYLPS